MFGKNCFRVINKSAIFFHSPNFQRHATRKCLRGVLCRQFSSTDMLLYKQAEHGPFIQECFKLYNPFVEDVPLQHFLKTCIPAEAYNIIASDLYNFGERIISEIYKIGLDCEQQLPYLYTYDAWGKRVDQLWTCEAWKQQRKISAEEGIVSIGYERKYHEWSRLYQISKLYLYSPVAGLYTCPLAMTDGAAKTIEELGAQNEVFLEAYKKLTTRDPSIFWTSGQWMTERRGGSDVANGTETVAYPEGNAYKLYGYKWFSSATDANMALTLARIVASDGTCKQGTKGLSLFYVVTKDEFGNLNNIEMVKLKNKLGTRQVPTAELLLDGTVAHRMSKEGQGVAGISHMLTLTRIHNATASVAAMRKILSLARDYSQKRIAFGEKIGNFPLHMQTLARLEVEVRGSMLLLFKVAHLLGKSECGSATDEDNLLLRLLTPILKLYTAKQAVAVVSEGLEAFGGQGYIEDTGLPAMLRDVQVLPIWEGTTNILALDVLRSISKTHGETLKAFMNASQACLNSARHSTTLVKYCSLVEESMNNIIKFAETSPDQLIVAARDFSYSIAATYIGALLLDNASNSECADDIIASQRWCELKELCPLKIAKEYYDKKGINDDYELVMKGYSPF